MDQRPNFLLIITEQHRGDCLGLEGHPALLTPNMDTIGRRGAAFRRAYTTCPSCIAARRSILSGQFPPTHGMVGYRDGVEWDAPPTLPGVLGRAGYQTYLVGRSMHQYPVRKRYGFDHMVIIDHKLAREGGKSEYEEWLKRNGAPEGAASYYATGVMHNDWTARPWHLDEALHTTNWAVMEALRFLETRDPSCPFFLVLSFVAAHPPLIPPAFYMERYLRMDLPAPFIGDWATPPTEADLREGVSPSKVDLKGEALRSCRAGYYGLINHVDDQIRRILNPVTGIDRMTDGNTVVILTSDHGEMLGDHYLWRKSVPYEPSARVPLLISAPPRFGIKPGIRPEAPVCLEDIMPTVLEMAGVEAPKTVEGRSLLPLMRGEKADWRPYLHIEHAPIHHTLTDGREKYIWFVRDGREQLFDLTADPNEMHDLAHDASATERVARWRALMVKELAGRPEGFSDGKTLIPGRPYNAVLPHAMPKA
jgi:arylsulfatase